MIDYTHDPDHQRVGITVHCTRCGRMKQPHGRSAPLEGSYCDYECSSYMSVPEPGCLWPGETCADFGYNHCHGATREIEID